MPFGHVHHVAMTVTDLARGGDGQAFDVARTGLDHLAFGVDSIEELSAWEQRFTKLGVPYSPPADAGSFGRSLNFKDPDGIALEIFVPAEVVPFPPGA